jgi:hypothetical protein
MTRHIPTGFLILSALLAVVSGCQKRGIQELVREELFSLSLGKMEDQIDLFQLDDLQVHKSRIFMSDGLYYVADGNSGKIMVFSSYGDLIFLLYNPQTNPKPVLLAPSASGDVVSTRASVSFPFRDIGEIAVSSDKTVYVDDEAPDGKTINDEKSDSRLTRVVLRFDRRGKPLGYIGQEGVGGTPFPYVMSLFVTGRDQLVVVCRLPVTWRVFWYSRDGVLLYQVEVDPKRLPSLQGFIPSLTEITPDMQGAALFLMIHYYRQTTDESPKTQSSGEEISSRVYRFNLTSQSFESYVELPPNPPRKEKSGLTTTEIPAPPNDLFGVSGNGFYYLMGFMDSNLYALTILDQTGRVREKRYMVIEDSELTFRDLRLSPSGLVYGLLCDKTRAHVSRWRSDLLLKGE